MKTTRIYFEDASFTDIRVSDIQTEEFYRWLRFANRNDTFKVPGMKQAIVRKSVQESCGLRKSDLTDPTEDGFCITVPGVCAVHA